MHSLPMRMAAPLAALALAGCAATPLSQTAPPLAASASVYEQGLVSAADERAAEAGAQMLRAGGSATDAAIATMLALTVVEPQSSGIGGGGFYLHADAAGKIDTVDGRETAPAAATPRRFLGEDGKPISFRKAVVGGLSVGVPGNIALAAEAHRRDGRLPWASLFAPAIRLARDGWVLTQRAHDALAARPDAGAHDPAARAMFYAADAQPLPVGTTIRNPQLARTFEAIAERGPDAFYKGALAQEIAGKVAAQTPTDGTMTAADIASYEAKSRAPVCGIYRVWKVCGMGPPSSGATTVIGILGGLERFDMAALGPQSPVAWHLFAEAQRLAYADREKYLADSDFVSVPVAGLVDHDYLVQRSAAISPDRRMPQVEAGTPPGASAQRVSGMAYPELGTSHFVVVDRDGEAVSYTSTIESAFGSGIMAGGFFLNNELTDFTFTPEADGSRVANRVEGGKRPRSSMAPTLIYGPDGKLVLAIGAAGGTTIPVQVARSIIGHLDWKLPIDQALALPVLFSPGETVIIERGSALEAMIPTLEKLGHKVVTGKLPLKTNAIAVDGRTLAGAADPRSEGDVVGP